MLDSTKYNPQCRFNDEIISFVYDEIDDAAKSILVKHLANCQNCTDEVNAFSSISYSIQDWKKEEFANLASPSIYIPYPAEKPVDAVNSTNNYRKMIRRFFTVPTTFAKTAAAFGTVAVILGFGIFLSIHYLNNSTETAGTKDTATEQLPMRRKSIEPILEKVDEVAGSSNAEVKTEVPIEKQKTAAITDFQTSVKRIKTFGEKVEVKKSNNVKAPKKNSGKIESVEIDIQEIPGLTDFALENNESDDIKLSDIFAEIETDR